MILRLHMEIYLFCIFVILIVLLQIKRAKDNRAQQLQFARMLVTVAVLIALEMLWTLMEYGAIGEGTAFLGWAVNSVFFIVSGIVGVEWVLFSELVQKSKLYMDKRLRRLCIIPVVVIAVFAVTAYWNHWLFYIDENGIYHRGSVYFIQIICSYIMPLLSTVKAFIRSFNAREYTQRREFRALGMVIIMPFVTFVIQMLLPGTPAQCVGLTIGAMSVFIFMKDSQISTDPLTGLNNRYRMDMYLQSKLEDYVPGKKRLFLMMMDVDEFKSINDTYGHIVGDEAIKHVSQAVKTVGRNTNVFIGRYGGDEFTIICEAASEEELIKISGSINSILSEKSKDLPYSLSLSIGIAEYSEDMKSAQAFIAAADQRLYEAKNAKKKLTKKKHA